MKVSKTCLMIILLVTLFGVVMWTNGCKEEQIQGTKAGRAVAARIELCTKCGQIKGSELCCKPKQITCPDCGLVKGSPGCCKIPKGAKTAEICTACEQIKGSTLSCKHDQAKCSKCGLTKGSPASCKLPKR